MTYLTLIISCGFQFIFFYCYRLHRFAFCVIRVQVNSVLSSFLESVFRNAEGMDQSFRIELLPLWDGTKFEDETYLCNPPNI